MRTDFFRCIFLYDSTTRWRHQFCKRSEYFIYEVITTTVVAVCIKKVFFRMHFLKLICTFVLFLRQQKTPKFHEAEIFYTLESGKAVKRMCIRNPTLRMKYTCALKYTLCLCVCLIPLFFLSKKVFQTLIFESRFSLFSKLSKSSCCMRVIRVFGSCVLRLRCNSSKRTCNIHESRYG